MINTIKSSNSGEEIIKYIDEIKILKSKISMLEEQLKTENTEEINNLNKK